MSHIITCPTCGTDHSIADMELWEVYEEDGKETEIECHECEKVIKITSRITGWHFDTELASET